MNSGDRRICFGVVVTQRRTPRHVAAYALTLRLLRLHNPAARRRTVTGEKFDALLAAASVLGYDGLLAATAGTYFVDMAALLAFIEQTPDVAHEIRPGLVYVDLRQWRKLRRPPFSLLQKSPVPLSLTWATGFLDADDATAYYVSLSALQGFALDWLDRPWFLNYEQLSCGTTPPGPLRTFFSVAAGLKPNAILHTAGFTRNTRVVLFDVSRRTLDFKRWLVELWNGDDYAGAIRRWLHVSGIGDVDDDLLLNGFDERVAACIATFGGRRELRRHWERYRRLEHRYWQMNVLGAERSALLREIRESLAPRTIWWSNTFHSLYTKVFQDEAQSAALFGSWIAGLKEAHATFGIGTDSHGVDVSGMIDRLILDVSTGFSEPAAAAIPQGELA